MNEKSSKNREDFRHILEGGLYFAYVAGIYALLGHKGVYELLSSYFNKGVIPCCCGTYNRTLDIENWATHYPLISSICLSNFFIIR